MQDSNVLITGGTSGMGKATADRLAKMGARLLLMGRNRGKGEAAVSEIMSATGNESVSFMQADLSTVGQVRSAAERIRQSIDRLDVLVHGAGGAFPGRRTLTDDGLELSFALQYLSRYVLTNELLDVLRSSSEPKVLSIAGGGGYADKIDFDNLNGEKSYGRFGAIAMNAATNDLLTLEQTARYPNITFYNYGPGLVRTNTAMPNLLMRLLLNTLGRPFTRSPEQAADNMVTLLTGGYAGGHYDRSLEQVELAAEKSADASRLRDYSEELLATL